jgi:N-acetylneuraminate synthase
LAARLVDVAAGAGVDAVKFQIFKTEKVLSRNAPKAEYQKRTTDEHESFLEMGRKLELSFETFANLRRRCEERQITFLASPFDSASLQFLLHEAKVPLIKIASGEVTNAPLLLQAAQGGLPVILSTGMCGLDEVEAALSVLAYGYLPRDSPPSIAAFQSAYQTGAGRRALRENVILLHCTTEYPAPVEDANLLAMDTLREKFGLPAGLSDHTQGVVVSIAAAARGAVVIEKHFTLDRNMPGPDHAASLDPDELAAMVRGIRHVESALGSSLKQPATSESKNKPIARRSLVAARPIKSGEAFTDENLTSKRPGTGVSPMRFWEFLGRPADKNYETDELIDPGAAPA